MMAKTPVRPLRRDGSPIAASPFVHSRSPGQHVLRGMCRTRRRAGKMRTMSWWRNDESTAWMIFASGEGRLESHYWMDSARSAIRLCRSLTHSASFPSMRLPTRCRLQRRCACMAPRRLSWAARGSLQRQQALLIFSFPLGCLRGPVCERRPTTGLSHSGGSMCAR